MKRLLGPRRAIGLLPWIVALAAAGSCHNDPGDTAAESLGTAPELDADAGVPCGSSLTYENFGGAFLLNWCTGCHHSALEEGDRQDAPLGVDFDNLEGVRENAPLMATFVETKLMPPLGGPTDEERELFIEWLDCEAPGRGFSPPIPDTPEMMLPMGECATPLERLPESALPRCSAGTHACVLDCETLTEGERQPCRDACIQDDGYRVADILGTLVNCQACVFNQLLACTSARDCDEQTAQFRCCLEGCAGSEDADCAASQCADELTAFILCVFYRAPECVDYSDDYLSSCFEPGEAPDRDAGATATLENTAGAAPTEQNAAGAAAE